MLNLIEWHHEIGSEHKHEMPRDSLLPFWNSPPNFIQFLVIRFWLENHNIV